MALTAATDQLHAQSPVGGSHGAAPGLGHPLSGFSQTVPGGRHVFLFLSLHLILLAFFLVLNALSTVDRTKAEQVTSNVSGTFLRGGTGIETSRGQALRSLETAVTGALTPTIPLTEIGPVDTRGDLDAELPVQTFFAGDSLVVRDPLPLLDRLVAVVSTPPDGFRYELDILFRTPVADGGYPTDMTPDVARAGALSRALVGRGMPPTALAVGLEQGDPLSVRLRFYLVERNADAPPGRPVRGAS